MQLNWIIEPPYGHDFLGFIPNFLDDNDPDSAEKQLDKHYQHGGGFRPFAGFKLNTKTLTLSYPGDPPMQPVAQALLRDERIVMYRHAWVAIIQPDNYFVVSRMD